jgi:cystine transport system permease protein
VTPDTWELVQEAFWPLLRGTLVGTIPLALISMALALNLALGVAMARLYGPRPVQWLARAYVSVIRGTPLLVQLFIVFYGLPSIGVKIDPWPSAVIALSLNVAGYAAEIIRAAVQSVPKGQWEAAYTVGMNRRLTLQRIILPQAVRVSVPPLSNSFISLVKDTSLTSLILVTEMFREAQEVAASSGEFMTLYVMAAVYYWVVCLALSAGQSRLETRLERHVAH